jgi:hypothetical protein
MSDINDFLTDFGHHSKDPCWWNFEFPSGRNVNVCLSTRPFLFDVEMDPADPDDDMVVLSGQTSEQVLSRLGGLAGEPKKVTA